MSKEDKKGAPAMPAIVDTSKYLTLYRNMCAAIAECDAVDECKDIIDKSVGLAAYYQQIKDTQTERVFYQVRLRAWRRIDELFSVVDLSECLTHAAKIHKIRDSFDEAVVDEFSDSRVLEILRLMTVPDASFEIALQQITGGSIANLLQYTLEAVAEAAAEIEAQRAANEKARREHEKEVASPAYQKKLKERQKQLAEQQRQAAERQRQINQQLAIQQRHERELQAATEVALKEVGITLERKDRTKMKQVVFLIRQEVHTVMRQAAFDQRITMQEILRRGLKLYLIAHGCEFPEKVAMSRDHASKENSGNANHS